MLPGSWQARGRPQAYPVRVPLPWLRILPNSRRLPSVQCIMRVHTIPKRKPVKRTGLLSGASDIPVILRPCATGDKCPGHALGGRPHSRLGRPSAEHERQKASGGWVLSQPDAFSETGGVMPPPQHKPEFLDECTFLTVKDIAKRWNVNPHTVRRLIRECELEARCHWHTYYVSERSVSMFEERHRNRVEQPR